MYEPSEAPEFVRLVECTKTMIVANPASEIQVKSVRGAGLPWVLTRAAYRGGHFNHLERT